MDWPNRHKFAFTIVDDTDAATIANVKPVYDLLFRLGMRTTKTAWIFRGANPKKGCGSTCEENDYLDWLLSLQRQGFELAFHNAAPCTSTRELTEQALLRFRQLFGPHDLLSCNHMGCGENIYWGPARLSGLNRLAYQVATKGRQRNAFRGEIEGDPLFWGDLCRRYVRYVRNFVFDELDALSVCPEQPYHDSKKPFVNFWFTSADGGTVTRFLKNFTVERLRQLEAAGGMCIAYVHFGKGFAPEGVLNPEFQKRLEFVASLNGWFVPASEMLDYLRQGGGPREREINRGRLRQLERRWLLGKLANGTS